MIQLIVAPPSRLCLRFMKVLGNFNRNRGVRAIGIGADRLGEFLVQRCAADQDGIVLADAPFSFRVSITTFI